jgi:uncharacterized protein (DUF1778 family)
MTVKKTVKKRKAGKSRPDRRSKKRSGYVNQTVRVLVEENRMIREAADLEGMSINFWAVRVLLAAAKSRIAKNNKQLTPESE